MPSRPINLLLSRHSKSSEIVDEKKPRENPRPLPLHNGSTKDALRAPVYSLPPAKMAGRTSIAGRLCLPNQTDNQAAPAGQIGTFLTKPKL